MEKGIVYYSRSNNTRIGAEYLGEKIKAEPIELVEKKGRKGLLGFLKSGYQAVTGKSSRLQGDPWTPIKSLPELYFITPIWGSHSTPAMNAFLERADLQGKTVTLITFQADVKGSGSEQVHQHIKNQVEKRGGTFLQGIALHSAAPGKFAGKEHIEKQIEKALKELE